MEFVSPQQHAGPWPTTTRFQRQQGQDAVACEFHPRWSPDGTPETTNLPQSICVMAERTTSDTTDQPVPHHPSVHHQHHGYSGRNVRLLTRKTCVPIDSELNGICADLVLQSLSLMVRGSKSSLKCVFPAHCRNVDSGV